MCFKLGVMKRWLKPASLIAASVAVMACGGGSSTSYDGDNLGARLAPGAGEAGAGAAGGGGGSAGGGGTASDFSLKGLVSASTAQTDYFFIRISGDGSKVAYREHVGPAGVGQTRSVYVINADGTGKTKLTTKDATFALTADGANMVISTQEDLLNPGNTTLVDELYYVKTDGSGVTQLTDFSNSSSKYAAYQPRISDDGSKILFYSLGDHTGSNASNQAQLYSIASDGSGLAMVGADWLPVGDKRYEISGDGSKLVFISDKDLTTDNGELSDEVFLANIDGSGLVQVTDLTDTGSMLMEAVRIDDSGSKIAFTASYDPLGSNAEAEMKPFTINSNGSGITQLVPTGQSVNRYSLDISGDAGEVYYMSDQIFRTGFSGNGTMAVTPSSDSSIERYPRTTTDGDTVVFHSSSSPGIVIATKN